MDREPITKAGAEALKAELSELKTVKRPAIIAAISEAREHGDLKENAEYHAAREQQSFAEGRIQELEASLSNAQIVDVASLSPNGKVVFGASVKLEDLDTEEVLSYQIVGNIEADIEKNKISVSSPIARALLGKEEGDDVMVKAPAGDREFEIIGISYDV